MYEYPHNAVNCSLEHTRFKCFVGSDKYKEIVAYSNLLKYINKTDGNSVILKFKHIMGHEGPPTLSYPK